MSNARVILIASAIGFGLPAAAGAQSNTDLDQIRNELRELKESYESRIQALEKRLKEAEDAAAKAQTAASQAQTSAAQAQQSAQAASAATAPTPPSGGAGANAFNPAISLILDGTYRNYSQDPNTRSVTGFLPQGSVGLLDRGFNLDESELTLSANVDHVFYAQATLAVDNGSELDTEEAFFSTTALGHGLTLKGGRFFSSVGYWNSQHPHAWDFVDPSLVQNAFLGPNLGMDAVQASWIAPLPVFLELGAEGGRPVDFPSAESDHNKNGISGGTLFAHLGGDIGDSGSYRVGGWYLQSGNRVSNASLLDLDETTGASNLFSGGDTKVWGLDVVYKWAPEGNPTDRNFKLAAEWMQRRIDGVLTYDATSKLAVGPVTDALVVKQSGWYIQGTYQFVPAWRAGLRYDQLQPGSYDPGPGLAGLLAPPDFTPKRYSAMVDWNPSEFSRIRLQYNLDRSQLGITDNQVMLQYIFSLGSHGAHKF